MTTTAPPRPEDLILAMPESVYRVLKAIPELGAQPGDFIIVHPNDPDVPCALERPLPLEVALRLVGGTEAPLAFARPPADATLENARRNARPLRLVRSTRSREKGDRT